MLMEFSVFHSILPWKGEHTELEGHYLTLQWEYVNCVTASSEQSRICCSLHLFPLEEREKDLLFIFLFFMVEEGEGFSEC